MTATSNEEMHLSEAETESRYRRLARLLSARWRPYLGWSVLIGCAVLAMLPAWAVRANNWVDLGRYQTALEGIGPLGVLVAWWIMGWRHPRGIVRYRVWRALAGTLLAAFAGLFLLSQLLLGWIPGPILVIRAVVFERSVYGLWQQVAATWAGAFGRLALWWSGVQAGGASQDNLVFAGLAGIVLWMLGVATALLARRSRQGFLAAAPALWLLGAILLYSRSGQILLPFGLGIALLLQLLLDHNQLLQRWASQGLDYSTGLFTDRLMLVIGAGLLLLTAAAIMPNLYIEPLVDRYYERMRPVYASLEETADRFFPGVKGVSRLGSGGLSGGLPNEFLLSAGPELGDAVVMRVRTSDSAGYGYPYESGFDRGSPPGHYMRGGTLAHYDGRGWSNPDLSYREDASAGEALAEIREGRKEVVQSVALSFSTQALYAAPEPVEASVDLRLGLRAAGDIVALWSRERSYTVVSATPAITEEMLAAEPSWDDLRELPPGYQIHLQLPDTITQRTRDLAAELTEGLDGPYAKAQAIEDYLRSYEYDLHVSEPPEDVEDVADYFLFDLQRGYCDYYATAFVALARLSGLPTRFATGFAIGNWDPADSVWIITEAEAHSWPEVYFPTYGWIPFEPTAGRPSLVRTGLPQNAVAASEASGGAATVEETSEIEWNWQMLFWLIPLGLLVWGAVAALRSAARKREDPWLGLLRWGSKAGRPMTEDQTILEYGGGLADYVATDQTHRVDSARIASQEIRSLAGAVNLSKYAPAGLREQAGADARQHWDRLRDYLRSLRRRR